MTLVDDGGVAVTATGTHPRSADPSAPAARWLRSRAGFTLPELIIVVTLGILMAAIAIPVSMTAIRANRLRSATFSIASKLAEARTNALMRNRNAWVLLDAAARTARVQVADGAGAPVNVGGPELLPAGVTFTLPGPTQQVTFDAIGRPVGGVQAALVNHPGLGVTRTITVATTGRITVS